MGGGEERNVVIYRRKYVRIFKKRFTTGFAAKEKITEIAGKII